MGEHCWVWCSICSGVLDVKNQDNDRRRSSIQFLYHSMLDYNITDEPSFGLRVSDSLFHAHYNGRVISESDLEV